MSQKLGPLQTKWVEALESGKYQQGKETLFNDGKHCCLGVACRVMGIPESEWVGCSILDEEQALALKLNGVDGYLSCARLGRAWNLAVANDDGATFTEIAAFIRDNPEAVFTEEA